MIFRIGKDKHPELPIVMNLNTGKGIWVNTRMTHAEAMAMAYQLRNAVKGPAVDTFHHSDHSDHEDHLEQRYDPHVRGADFSEGIDLLTDEDLKRK